MVALNYLPEFSKLEFFHSFESLTNDEIDRGGEVRGGAEGPSALLTTDLPGKSTALYLWSCCLHRAGPL